MLEKIDNEGKAPAATCRKANVKEKASKKLQMAEEAMQEALNNKIKQKGWERMKPLYAFARLRKQFDGKAMSLSKADKDELSKMICSHYSTLKSQRKAQLAQLKKKSIVYISFGGTIFFIPASTYPVFNLG
jgi:hypothetical protein